MIRLSDKWTIEPDAHNWMLVETTFTTTKKYPEGREIRTATYHPTLQAVLRYWVEKEPKKATSVKELQEAVEKLQSLITEIKG